MLLKLHPHFLLEWCLPPTGSVHSWKQAHFTVSNSAGFWSVFSDKTLRAVIQQPHLSLQTA